MNTILKQFSKTKFLFLLTIMLHFLVPGGVDAQSCHGGSGGQTPVLSSSRRLLLGVSSSYRAIKGQFNPYGQYQKNPQGTSLNSFSTTIGAALRLSENWQLGLSLPLVYKQQTFSEKRQDAFLASDPVTEIRYALWDDIAFRRYRPGLNVYGGGSFPLGKSAYNSSHPYGTDIVGEGTSIFHMGMNASKTYRPFKFLVDGTFFCPLRQKVIKMHDAPILNPYRLKSGNRAQWIEGISYLFNNHWNASLNFKQLWILKTTIDRKIVESSAGRLFSTIAGIAYTLNTSLGTSFNYETPFPFYRYMVNQSHYGQFSMGLIYNFL